MRFGSKPPIHVKIEFVEESREKATSMDPSVFTNRLMLYRTKCIIDIIRVRFNLTDEQYNEMIEKFVNIQYVMRTTGTR